ncbi:MAG TPA: MFS transporter [Acidimicrobiales bacterium]|nr:MFS transporter [Acidimicrobiales bacterium]
MDIQARAVTADRVVREARTTRRLAWLSAALSALVVSANLSVMSVAFDSLRRSFPGTQLSVLGWVLSIYTIVFGAFLVPAGRLADHLGRRVMFRAGLVIFAAASLVAGLAPAIWVVIVGRVGQGIGAACLVPSTLGLLLDALPADQRASATAFYSAVASVGGALGPTLGGVLVQHGGWRWAFFIAPVFALLAWVTGRTSLPHTERTSTGPLPDNLGAILIVIGLTAMSLGIVESRDWGWLDARIIGSFVAAVAVVPLFVRRSRRHPVPILPIELTAIRSFSMANIASAIYGMSTGALLFSTVLFLRDVWGYSVVAAGSGLLPLGLASIVSSLLVGRLGNRFGERAVGLPGSLVVASGMGYLAWRAGPSAAFVRDWLPGGAIIGFGMGLTYPMIGAACVREVGMSDLSVASASNRMTLQIGNAIGIALVIAILGDAHGVETLDRMRVAWAVTAGLAVAVGGAIAALGPPRRALRARR